MNHPDGMANMRTELDHMREMKDIPSPFWDVIAVDEDGVELYVTESVYTEEEAEAEVRLCNNILHKSGGIPGEPRVDRFDKRRRDE